MFELNPYKNNPHIRSAQKTLALPVVLKAETRLIT